MTKLGAQFDPFALIPPQASRTEQVNVSAHTEVVIPWLRGMSVFRIRLGRAIGVMVLAGLAGGSCYWLVNGPEAAGWFALSALCLGVCVLWAAAAPFTSLERFQMAEIKAPGRDTERQAIAEMVLAYMREQQPVAVQPPIVRVESVVREPGRTTLRTAYNDDLPGTREQWCSLAGVVLRNVAPEAFALRTAESVGLSRDQWNAARDIFVRRGWAGWNHPHDRRQGVTLCLVGRRALREMLTQLEAAPYELTPMD